MWLFPEEVILAEERTTEEEKLHIIEARRRAAAKRKKLKNLGKSKSTDTEEEEEEGEGEDGMLGNHYINPRNVAALIASHSTRHLKWNKYKEKSHRWWLKNQSDNVLIWPLWVLISASRIEMIIIYDILCFHEKRNDRDTEERYSTVVSKPGRRLD